MVVRAIPYRLTLSIRFGVFTECLNSLGKRPMSRHWSLQLFHLYTSSFLKLHLVAHDAVQPAIGYSSLTSFHILT